MASRPLVASAFVVLVTAWTIWIAWLPARLDAGSVTGGTPIAAALTYRIAGLVCHQDAGRSFHHGPWAWPVCARCAGLYGGAAGGGLVSLAAAWWLRRGGARSATSLTMVRWALLLVAAPTAVLWVAEWVGGITVTNGVRWWCALPLGAGVSALVVLARRE